MEADASTLDMPSDCCYFVEKAAAAGAAPAFQYFDSIFHHFAVVTQNLGQTPNLYMFKRMPVIGCMDDNGHFVFGQLFSSALAMSRSKSL